MTSQTTLEDIMEQPGIKGKEYMIVPGTDASLEEQLGDMYHLVTKGKSFCQMSIEEISEMCSSWNTSSMIGGLEYLVNEAGKKQIFYDIWNEEEIKKEPSKRETGICAFPLQKNSKFVIICPGGGYSSVCTMAEGYGIAEKLNALGYSAFIVNYRVGVGMRQKPIDDLAQAIRFIFAHAEEFHVDIKQYGVMGFSAGAHLAGMFGTESLGYVKYGLTKPGILILGYPVVTMGVAAHEGSRECLLGTENKDDEKLREMYSIEKQITENFPPVYVWQCEKDAAVPIENSQVLVEQLERKGIACKYEVFPGDAHGWGLGIGTAAQGWLERAVSFGVVCEQRV